MSNNWGVIHEDVLFVLIRLHIAVHTLYNDEDWEQTKKLNDFQVRYVLIEKHGSPKKGRY